MNITAPYRDTFKPLSLWCMDNNKSVPEIIESGSTLKENSLIKAKKIFVSVRGDAIRVSPYVHNTEAQLFELVDVLKSCLHE